MDNPKLHVGRIHWTTWRKTSSQLLLELPTLQTFWPGLWTFDSSSPARLLFGLYSLNLWDKGGGHYSCCKCSLVQKQQVVTKILIEPRFNEKFQRNIFLTHIKSVHNDNKELFYSFLNCFPILNPACLHPGRLCSSEHDAIHCQTGLRTVSPRYVEHIFPLLTWI